LGSSERSNPRHYDPQGPLGLLRRKDDGRGPARWWPIALIVAALLLASGWWITKSPVFAARRVEVTGESHLTRADVLRLAGVGRGTNLFWFHAQRAERLLRRSPWIAAAAVTRSLPSTLRIAIRERRPVGQVKLRKGKGYFVVAADGTVLAHSRTAGGFPMLTFDRTASSMLHRLGRSAWVVGAMAPWVRSRVHAVAQTSDGSIVVHLASGVPVYFGDATQVQQKDQALAAVLHWAIAGSHPLASINLQAPLAPTATLNVYVPPVVVPVAPSASPSPGASPSLGASPGPSVRPSPARSPRSTVRHTKRRAKGTPSSKHHG